VTFGGGWERLKYIDLQLNRIALESASFVNIGAIDFLRGKGASLKDLFR